MLLPQLEGWRKFLAFMLGSVFFVVIGIVSDWSPEILRIYIALPLGIITGLMGVDIAKAIKGDKK